MSLLYVIDDTDHNHKIAIYTNAIYLTIPFVFCVFQTYDHVQSTAISSTTSQCIMILINYMVNIFINTKHSIANLLSSSFMRTGGRLSDRFHFYTDTHVLHLITI